MSLLYRARRIGKGGQLFTLYKFRTMVQNAAQLGGSSTADNDPRITRIGYFLRKTKLDELPQIINVLKGEMAFIGWRPESPEYLSTLAPAILATKPGIIGLATLWDSDEGATLKDAEDPDKFYAEKILPVKRKLELFYVENRGIRLNTWIILNTIKKLLLRRAVRFSNLSIALNPPTLEAI